MHKGDQKKSAQEPSQDSKGGTPGEMLLDTRKEEGKKKAAVRI